MKYEIEIRNMKKNIFGPKVNTGYILNILLIYYKYLLYMTNDQLLVQN